MRGRERLASQILTVLPFAQGLVVLYQPKRAGSLQQPLLEAKQFLIKALFFLECTPRYTKSWQQINPKRKKIVPGRK